MIDVHIHVTPPRLPGTGSLNSLLDSAVETIALDLTREMNAAGIDRALAMGCWDSPEDDPLGIVVTLNVARFVPGLHAIGVADPTKTDRGHLQRVHAVLKSGRVKALKGYLGYLHYAPDHPGYRQYYELAEQYRIPFIFHTGDTYSPRAKVRFAHPLPIDDVAVDHPNVRFVLAHLGNPWMTEAAEVVYKNMNVWTDLSGLVLGDVASFADEERRDLLEDTTASIRRAFRYAERPNRFLYGSDWPLVSMTAYRDFIRNSIPTVYHESVFRDNAEMLFRIS